MEKELQLEHSNLRDIMDAMEDGVYIVNQHFDIEYANPALEKQFGPAQGRKCYEYFHNRSEVCSWCKNEEVFAGKSVKWEWSSAKTGKTYDLFDTPIRRMDGSISKLEIFHDITDRKHAEESLRQKVIELEQSRREAVFLADLIEQSSQPLGVGYPNGRLGTVNSAFCRLVGYSRDELKSIDWASVLTPPEWLESERRHLEELHLTGKPVRYEKEYIRKDRTRVSIELLVHLVRDEYGQPQYYYAFVNDITDRKQMEGELRESEERYRTVADFTYDWEYWIGVDGRFIYISPSCERVTDYRTDEFYAAPDLMERIAHPDDQSRWRDHTRTTSTSPDACSLDFRIIRRDGQERWIGHVCQPVYSRTGQLLGRRASNRDITARKQREHELRAIATVSMALRVARSRTEMLPIILDQLLDLLKANGASVGMHDSTTDETVIELALGSAAFYTAARIPPGKGVNGCVIATGKPYANADAHTDPRLFRPELFGAMRAMACVPLNAHEKTIGAICVARDEKDGVMPQEFSESELRLLTAVADIAANAIHRATLHEDTQRHLERLQSLHTIETTITASLDLKFVLNILLEQTITQLHVDAADVLLHTSHTNALEYAAGRGFRSKGIERSRVRVGEGIVGRVALERRIVTILNLPEHAHESIRDTLLKGEGFVTYCGIPLVAKGKVVGVLEIFHRSPLRTDPGWLEFAETLAKQSAIAIDNMQLFEGLQRSNIQLALAYDATIEGWSRALDLRDKETEGHTQRVTEMTLQLARAMQMDEADLVHICRGALLHDIGKMGVPDSILLRPSKLTDEEWVIMRQHPQFAYDMLAPIAYLRSALDIPYCHHEKWDGTGYPRGLKGEQIPLAARIFAIADVWDALRSKRPYRVEWSTEKTRTHIQALTGTHFDPKVVEVFFQMLREE